ncbi:MAG: ATP-binding cassette domain-containing protein [Thermoproteota archaeon]|jgi:branched-chain amino acid transport system ATP-binding protein|nr:ATP-binding cassette domain-containing protein [Thermoproteota archaeon]
MLETINLTKHFGGIKAVDEVSFKIPNGNERIIGLMGPNGAGKTTLINLLTGYLKPDKGKIYLEDRNIENTSPEERVTKGLVRTFQLVSVFEGLTVMENLALTAYSSKQKNKRWNYDFFLNYPLNNEAVLTEVNDILDLFDLRPVRNKFVSELSYGYKRILEIAMAYTLKPKLLFLDEPFAGLSDIEIEKILMILNDLIKERKIQYLYIVDHKISWLKNFVQRLQVMFEGKIIADDKPENIIKDKKIVEIYWGSELR